MAERVCLESPAKINLRLEILGKREDGYHELRTVFQKISLHDTLYFSLREERGISIKADHPDLPTGEDNLVHKAVLSMIRESDYQGGVEVQIEKRIPLGAGLGGGSSNAATALQALNRLLEAKRSRKELMEIGLRIGADVPFFFLKKAAIGLGIGERLEEIELPSLWFVLIYPNFQVSAGWAYQNFVLTKTRFDINLQGVPRTPEEICRILRNDLEQVVSRKYPEIKIMKKLLLGAGALGALMTGSGPTVFGVYTEEQGAVEASRKVNNAVRGKGWLVITAHSIPS